MARLLLRAWQSSHEISWRVRCASSCVVFTRSVEIVELHLSPEERRQLEPESAFWSKFASAKAAHVLFCGASVTTVCLFFFVIGRVLTRLDLSRAWTHVVLRASERQGVTTTVRRSPQGECQKKHVT